MVRDNEDGVKSEIVLISQEDLLGNHPFNLVAGKHGDFGDLLNLSRIKEAFILVNVSDATSPLKEFEIDINKSKLSTEHMALFAFNYSNENEELAKLIWQDIKSLTDESRTVFCWYPSLTYYNKGSASWIVEGKIPVAHHTFFCDTSVVQSYIPIAFYRRVLNAVPGWSQRIAEHFGNIFELDPNSFTIQFVPISGNSENLQGWIARKDRPALSIDAFGDGARAAFKLLAPLLFMAEMATSEAPGLLLWEEPEAFQNPKTLGKLLREVVKIIHNKPIQVFIATHNLEVVSYITQMLQNQELNPENTRLFQMHLCDGQLKSTWFDRDNLLAWLESGLDPRAWEYFTPPFQFQLQEETV